MNPATHMAAAAAKPVFNAIGTKGRVGTGIGNGYPFRDRFIVYLIETQNQLKVRGQVALTA